MDNQEITEEDINRELDSLILPKYLHRGWNIYQMYRDKVMNEHHWYIMASEVRPEAERIAHERKKTECEWEIENEKRKQNAKNRNLPLCEDDIIGVTNPLLFDPCVIKQVVNELNVEICKRIVRESYPHKFA